MDNPEKLATLGIQDEDKQNKNTIQYSPFSLYYFLFFFPFLFVAFCDFVLLFCYFFYFIYFYFFFVGGDVLVLLIRNFLIADSRVSHA
jgi:hypothetical protein